jgi:hypothetical protein
MVDLSGISYANSAPRQTLFKSATFSLLYVTPDQDPEFIQNDAA